MQSTVLRKQIRNELISRLQAEGTSAAHRVYGTRAQKSGHDELPAVFVFLRKQTEIGASSTHQTFAAEIEIQMKVATEDSKADNDLDDFVNEIENAIYKHLQLGIAGVKQASFTQWDFDFDLRGARIIGECSMLGEIQFVSPIGYDSGHSELTQLETEFSDFGANNSINTRE